MARYGARSGIMGGDCVNALFQPDSPWEWAGTRVLRPGALPPASQEVSR